jgi:hypothetical protein
MVAFGMERVINLIAVLEKTMATATIHHKGPLIAYQLRKYFLPQPSPEWIFLSTLDTAYQITLSSPVLFLASIAGLPEIVM